MCTKNVHFTFNDYAYSQNDGVAMGSTLGPVLAGIIMFVLETKVVPAISNYTLNWKRFVDHIIGYVKTNKVEYVLKKLNKFYNSIQLMY